VVAEIEEDQKEKEERETVIRSVPNQKITELLQHHNISLSSTAKAGGVAEKQVDEQQQTKAPGETRKVVIQRTTTSLFLQKNQFRTITGLYKVLDDVMFNAGNLLWLDLSYNYLEKVEDEIVNNFR